MYIKLAFQMSIIDYSKTMNRSINLLDLYLLVPGINTSIHIDIRKKAEDLVRVEKKTVLLELTFFCLRRLFN
jgi:hypothetical protein